MEEQKLNKFPICEVDIVGKYDHSWVSVAGNNLILFCGKWLFVYGLDGSRKHVLDAEMWITGASEVRRVLASESNDLFCVSTKRDSAGEFDFHVSVSKNGQLVSKYSQARCAICDGAPKDESPPLRCRMVNERKFEIFVLVSNYPNVKVCKERCLPKGVGESVVCFTANAENGRMNVSLSETRKVTETAAFKTIVYHAYASSSEAEEKKSTVERTTEFCFLSLIGPDWDPRKVVFVPYKPRWLSPKETAKKNRSWRLGANKKKYLGGKK